MCLEFRRVRCYFKKIFLTLYLDTLTFDAHPVNLIYYHGANLEIFLTFFTLTCIFWQFNLNKYHIFTQTFQDPFVPVPNNRPRVPNIQILLSFVGTLCYIYSFIHNIHPGISITITPQLYFSGSSISWFFIIFVEYSHE